MRDAILGILRHTLTTAGGVLVGNGVLTSDQLNSGVGAVLVLSGLIWSVMEKRGRPLAR